MKECDERKRALYAFSGDPITFGHIDIIKRSLAAFDEVIVGIGVNPDKKYMFTLQERTDMANKALAGYQEKLKITSFTGLLVDFAYENNIKVIVKGVRNSEDFNYENILHQCGETQKLGIDTFLLIARPDLAHISSSMVKAMQKEQGFINDYVPLNVKQKLEEKMSGQYIIGMTGEPGTGKSFIGDRFVKYGESIGLEVHNIELDHIGHEILESLNEPVYIELRNKISETFGDNTMNDDGSINRKILGDIVFNDQTRLDELNKLMYTPLLVRLRHELYGKKGLLIFNAALIAETDLSYICNNNVVIVGSDEATRNRRLSKRNLTEDQIKRRIASQMTFGQKENFIERKIEESGNGKLWIIDNSGNADDTTLYNMFNQILKDMEIAKG